MQAIVQDSYGSADVLQLREIARPRIGANDVLIRVHAAGVDFGVWHLMAGLPYAVRLVMGVRRPRNPVRGTELAGVVDAVGANVTALQVGDEVFGVSEGSFAEYARASPARVLAKPANLTFEQAERTPRPFDLAQGIHRRYSWTYFLEYVMSKVPAIIPVSDLREDAANILGRMRKSHDPVVITQRGRAAAVMVSIEEYERSNHEREILRLLAQGDKEVAAGKGYELEDVLKEAERILAE